MPPAPKTRHRAGRKDRRDKDGDLIMAQGPRAAVQKHHAQRDDSTASTTELKVTGWTDKAELAKIIGFLERHASRRAKSSGKRKMIKRHRVTGETLYLSVSSGDVNSFGKISGFTFGSTHGPQLLTISGPGIRSKSPQGPEAGGNNITSSNSGDSSTNSKEQNSIRTLLGEFLSRRYSKSDKLLNLSSIAEDEEVAKTGMFTNATAQLKFFPALMVICNEFLKTADQKRDAVESVVLSNNNLADLKVVRELANTLPHIKNLDLSGNKFAGHHALKPWKGRFRLLEHLITDEFTSQGWQDDIISWFPKLRILNGQYVRPDHEAPPAEVIATEPSRASNTVEQPQQTLPLEQPQQTLPAEQLQPPPVEQQPQQAVLNNEQESMIIYVQQNTQLKREMAIQCLEAGGWNLQQAAELFQKSRATLPADAFN